MKRLLTLCLLLVALTAYAANVDWINTSGKEYPPTDKKTIQVFLDGLEKQPIPAKSFEIGRITYKSKHMDKSVDIAKKLAAKHGGHAIYAEKQMKERGFMGTRGVFIVVRNKHD